MTDSQTINIFGVASCYGAQDLRCADAPIILKQLHLKETLESEGFNVQWNKNIYPDQMPTDKIENTSLVLNVCKQLARQVRKSVSLGQKFIVIGGDHSCAIGTWSGVHASLQGIDDFGLIWIDAHMDSHTPSSSPSGAIHGMPIAALLGYGDEKFCSIESKKQKIKPENLCLVGIRSFEKDEADLLNNLGVKIFYIDDILKLGLEKVLSLAQQHINKNTTSFGISIDLDAIDPVEAPGVGSPEENGLHGEELQTALSKMTNMKNLLGIEITELNSKKDDSNKTAQLAIKLIKSTLKN